MAMDPYPPPIPDADHTIEGPAEGHSFNKPVSFEMPVRSGPCHPGQSMGTLAPGDTAARITNSATRAKRAIFMIGSMTDATIRATRQLSDRSLAGPWP